MSDNSQITEWVWHVFHTSCLYSLLTTTSYKLMKNVFWITSVCKYKINVGKCFFFNISTTKMIKPYERYHWTSLQFNRKIDCLIGIFLFPTVFLTLRGWLPDAHQISSIKGIFPHQTPSLYIIFQFISPNCELTWHIDVMSDCWPW